MKKTVKITDVAERAGVAKSTVSNVLTGRKFVSEELKEKVLEACKELDFHPNFYASGLSSHKSNIIALMLESSDNIERTFYSDLIIACIREASKHDYAVLIYYNAESDKLLNMLRHGMAPIDGAVLMTPCVSDERFAQIEEERIDCMVIGRPDNAPDLNYVDINNKQLVKDVCEELISRYGNDIYLFNSNSSLTISQDRTESFCEVCEKFGIDVRSHHLESKRSTEEDGYDFAKDVIKKDSVFVTANGYLAAGVYRAAEEKGLRVGKDVGVFALGRSLKHGSFKPQLSYAEQDYSFLGKKAVSTLIDQIENGYSQTRILIDSKKFFTESVNRD